MHFKFIKKISYDNILNFAFIKHEKGDMPVQAQAQGVDAWIAPPTRNLGARR
jgi:hypothetical protein